MQNSQSLEKPQIQPQTSPIICSTCQKPNRNIAKFCRYCGTEIKTQVSSSPTTPPIHLEEIIGHEVIKEEIRGMTNQIRLFKERKKAGLPAEAPYLHSIFMGNTGTGKTLVARYMAKNFCELGLLFRGSIPEIRSP